MSTKQEIVSDAAFKAWPFLSDFKFACKNSQVTEAKCKYYNHTTYNNENQMYHKFFRAGEVSWN